MKKIAFCIVLLLVTSLSAYSLPVDPAKAYKAAEQFFTAMGVKKSDCRVNDVSNSVNLENIYVFNLENEGGFVVIAGDDNTEPVLAYSLEKPFPTTTMPAHVRAWFRGYELEIKQNSNAPKSQTASAQWQRIMNAQTASDSKELISQILNTLWDQSPYYNEYCPFDSTMNRRPPCGCTATATAQIMKAFNHPQQGYGQASYRHWKYGVLQADFGNTTYQWDTMPKKLDLYSNQTQINAVAELIYHIGVGVKMAYHLNGSAGKTASYGYGGEPSSENVLKYNLGYSPYIWSAFRIDYNLDDWKELMVNELRHGRPILYAGYDEVQSGHAFVLDGYNSANDRFHINWGWGGSYNAYYKLDNLTPSAANNTTDYNFNLFATATIGIEPYADFNPTSTTTVVTAAEGEGSVTGAGTYQFGDTITMTATASNRYTRFVQWSDGCRYNPRQTVATGGELQFTAQFAPLRSDTLRFHTCDNAMNRASNLPEGLGLDSVWGIRIPAEAIKSGAQLNAIRFMGRREATHTLTILSGTDSPETELYSATFFDSLAYPYTWHQHDLTAPIAAPNGQSLWVVLKCTEIDTPGVFSIYGGNPYGILSGANLEEKDSEWKFSWMIEALFSGNAGINEAQLSSFNFQLYPNPANGRTLLQGLPKEATVDIVDASGRSVFSTKPTDDKLDIDTSKMPSGIYIVRVTSNYGSATQRMVVK